MVEILKQGQLNPFSLSKQVMIIYAGVNGFLDDLPNPSVQRFEQEFFQYVSEKHPDIIHEIETKKEFSDDLKLKLEKVITSFKHEFLKGLKK